MSKYRNNTALDDSSVGSAFYRTGVEDSEEYDENGVYLITMDDDGNRLCHCGCLVRVGNRSQFLQGHDAKLKGILQRAHHRGSEIHIIAGGDIASTSAYNEARNRGWTKFLVEFKARQERQEQERADRKAKRATGRTEPRNRTKPPKDEGKLVEAKVGRWTYTGVVIDGEFFYADKNGKSRIAKKYTLV